MSRLLGVEPAWSRTRTFSLRHRYADGEPYSYPMNLIKMLMPEHLLNNHIDLEGLGSFAVGSGRGPRPPTRRCRLPLLPE